MKKQLSILVLTTAVLLSGCAQLCKESTCAKASCTKATCPSNIKEKVVLSTNAYFTFDSAELNKSSMRDLDAVAKRLNANTTEKVRINGFTDNIGTDAYNLDLSKRRALAVARYLESQGVAGKRISVFGLGATNFIASNETAEGRAKNRRTEILFYE